MNYAQMSDFEINSAVAAAKGYDTNVKQHFGEAGLSSVKTTEGTLDFCNSWADAGPIIQGNYLSIECDDMFDVPMSSSYWKAHNPKGNHYTDENPLRAAMIVFLMMQEGK